MAETLEVAVDTRVSPAFNALSITEAEFFDEDTQPALQQVADVFSTVHASLGKVFDAKDAASANTAWNEDMRVIKVQEAADRFLAKFAPQLTKVLHNMHSGVAMYEKELSAPIEAQAALTISTQIRDHVKGLAKQQGTNTLDKRPGVSAVGFVQQAIQKGDAVTASAVLGAPAYLSGLTDDMHAVLLRMWHEKQNPVAAKRVKAMSAAAEMIADRGLLLHRTLEKLVGKPPSHARALRDRNAAAEKALGGI